VAHGEDAAKDGMQAPETDAVRHGALAEPDRGELTARDHAVLAARQLGDRPFRPRPPET
jgi:hypothetical protein